MSVFICIKELQANTTVAVTITKKLISKDIFSWGESYAHRTLLACEMHSYP